MLKFTLTEETRTLIGLGLSDGNIKRLRADEPILVKLDEMGIGPGHAQPIEILIVTGVTETEIMGKLRDLYGLEIGPETITHIDPRLAQ